MLYEVITVELHQPPALVAGVGGACEEAGIVPEIWVHIEATGTNRFRIGVQDNGPGIMRNNFV